MFIVIQFIVPYHPDWKQSDKSETYKNVTVHNVVHGYELGLSPCGKYINWGV
jgi:hypothetical protein